jgi:aminoglycoside phosphotransferase (APT) family kinase protein
MSQNNRLDVEINSKALSLFLFKQQLIENKSAELTITQFTNGYSNLTYLLEFERKYFVLRMPPKGAVKRGHDMAREYKVLSKLHSIFPKAPKAIVFSNDLEILGAPFYLMEKVDGIILTTNEAKSRDIPPVDFRLISEKWLDTFVELHQLDYKSVGLEDLGKPEGYVQRQVSNWGKQYLSAATMEVPEAHHIMQWMENNQPHNYAHRLIHNDFKYDNIVFKDESWKEVTAVLDWEMCTLGDPLMDLGTSLAYWTMKSDGPMVAQGLPSPTLLSGNPGRSEIVEMYALKSGRNVDHLVFYYVYGLFKIAVIAQQIYYRYHKGLTSNEKFASLDKASQFLCLMGWQAVQKNRIENLF